LKVNNIAVES